MADFIKGIFGGAKPSASSVVSADEDFADFADYATAAPPSPPSHAASAADAPNLFASPTGLPTAPYTKWYRVWERTQVSDFYQEMFILPIILIFVGIHLWGSRSNKRKARGWINTHGPILQEEFACLGFDNKSQIAPENSQGTGFTDYEALLKEKAANEYTTYATGRQNIGFVDIRLIMTKRYNPLIWLGEILLSFFFDSIVPPEERVELTAYSFANKEPEWAPAGGPKPGKSDYDGFVWAVIHKDLLKRLRNDRYDLSLTSQRDHAKLPIWATVLTESAEVTDALLTPELLQAIEQAGESLEALIVTDQPIDKPKTLDELEPKKRISLALRLPESTSDNAAPLYASTLPLFRYFLRLPDQLVSSARFRPEVLRRVRQTREDEARKIRKVDEDEKRDKHKTAEDKRKKEERDKRLKGMSAEEQRKFLEKEKERDMKRAQKKRTMRA